MCPCHSHMLLNKWQQYITNRHVYISVICVNKFTCMCMFQCIYLHVYFTIGMPLCTKTYAIKHINLRCTTLDIYMTELVVWLATELWNQGSNPGRPTSEGRFIFHLRDRLAPSIKQFTRLAINQQHISPVSMLEISTGDKWWNKTYIKGLP